jgi:membrane-associated phospholipid phosphatase
VAQAQLERETTVATTRMDAPRRPLDFSWLVQMLVWLGVTAALVTVAYFFVDQPVMSFISSCRLDRHGFLKWLTRPPEVFVLLSPFVLLAGLFRRFFGPWTRPEKVAVAAAVSTLFTALAALLLKITFGRGGDGFHPFHFGAAYWAFPSGHTACTLSVAAVAAVAFPRWRPCWWLVAGVVAATLIALNYHFVGDILGGAFVGWAIGVTAAKLFGLEAATRRHRDETAVGGCSGPRRPLPYGSEPDERGLPKRGYRPGRKTARRQDNHRKGNASGSGWA